MLDKISKKLIMGERFVLLNNLPKEGDLVTYNLLKKLRATLSPNEQEIKDYKFVDSFRCPYRKYDEDGQATQCEVEGEGASPPKCHIHDVFMEPIGRVSWSEEMWDTKKTIWFGNKANQIIVDTLKKLGEEDKKINDDIVASLYEKFVKTEEE